MKKFRMMLPMVALVFAFVGAVAGELLPISQGYYKIVSNCSPTAAALDQANCQLNLPTTRPVCTVSVSGHPQAFNDSGCNDILRYIPQ